MTAAHRPLPPALPGERHTITTSPAGALSYYRSAGQSGPPLLLVHSINAAGSAYEMKPLYDAYQAKRPVYALDLPGFGFSERSDRVYTPRLMTDAIHAMADAIRSAHGNVPIDAAALSLSCEFLARAISERPEHYRSAALISPTGFDKKAPYNEPPGTTRAMPWLYRFFTVPLWTRQIYKGLTAKRTIRFFLEKTWGSKNIDEGLLEYDYRTTHQPGARFAPYYFVSGYLFSRDITRVYEKLLLPVWMSHGNRGDFQDYSYAAQFEQRPNWTVTEFDSGALPFFEVGEAFIPRYDAFLAQASQRAA